jgi:hypothetical protein
MGLVAPCVAFALFSAQAAAIIGGLPDGPEPDSPERRIDENRCDSPWAGVVSLQIGQGVFSGVIVADRWVLTAAHVAAGMRQHPEGITIHVPCRGAAIAADRVEVNPAFTGYQVGRINVDDLALVHLHDAAPAAVPRYPLLSRIPPPGTVATLVGYGAGGDPLRGGYVPARMDVKRVGENALDAFIPGPDGKTRGFIYDFDGPDPTTNMIGGGSLGNRREATVATGDSGSPVFVRDGGRWFLAGISTFQMRFPVAPPKASPMPPHFGSGGGGMLVAPYADWIRSIIDAHQP